MSNPKTFILHDIQHNMTMKWQLTLKEADKKVKSWLNVGLYNKYLWGFSRLAGFSLGSCGEIFGILLLFIYYITYYVKTFIRQEQHSHFIWAFQQN